MTHHIEDRTLTAQDTAVIRSSMPDAHVPAWLAGVYAEIHRYLTEQGLRVSGPPFARYAVRGDIVDVEAGFPVPAPVPGGRRVTPSRLPGGRAAVASGHGRREDLAYHAVAGWLKQQAAEPAGAYWEVYYTNPSAQPDTASWGTDLVAPYRRT